MSEHPHGGWEPMPGQRPHQQPYQQQPYPQPYGPGPYGHPGQPPYAPVPPPQQDASGRHVPLIVAAGVFAAVTAIAIVVALLNRNDDGGSTTALAAPTTASASVSASEAAPSSGREPMSPSRTPAAGIGSQRSPIPLGQSAPVGDYVVTVTNVILDGDAVVAGANQFNDPPTGRYVIVEATAEYVGVTEGNPFWDLSYVFNGTDARQYTDTQCSAVLPNDAIDAPTLNPGGSASFQVCMDVPPAAIDGGVLFFEPLVSYDAGERIWFAIR